MVLPGEPPAVAGGLARGRQIRNPVAGRQAAGYPVYLDRPLDHGQPGPGWAAGAGRQGNATLALGILAHEGEGVARLRGAEPVRSPYAGAVPAATHGPAIEHL